MNNVTQYICFLLSRYDVESLENLRCDEQDLADYNLTRDDWHYAVKQAIGLRQAHGLLRDLEPRRMMKFSVLIAMAEEPQNVVMFHIEATSPELAELEAACQLYKQEREWWSDHAIQTDPLVLDDFVFHGVLWGFCEWVGDYWHA